jgi:hypothetical protein
MTHAPPPPGPKDVDIRVHEAPEKMDVQILGEISMKDPSAVLMPHFEDIHRRALDRSLEEVRLDLTGLDYLNSAGILALIKWIKMVQDVPGDRRYKLHVVYTTEKNWQRIGIKTMCLMAEDVVRMTKI